MIICETCFENHKFTTAKTKLSIQTFVQMSTSETLNCDQAAAGVKQMGNNVLL